MVTIKSMFLQDVTLSLMEKPVKTYHVPKTCIAANYSCVKCKNRQHVSICSAKDDKRKINADNNVADASTPSQTTLYSATIISKTAKATVLNLAKTIQLKLVRDQSSRGAQQKRCS